MTNLMLALAFVATVSVGVRMMTLFQGYLNSGKAHDDRD